MLDIAFQKFDKNKHFFTDPFPHIFIENSLTEDQIKSITEKLSEYKMWRDYPSDFRIDYSLPLSDQLPLYNQLCDIFDMQQYKKDKIFPSKTDLFTRIDKRNPDNNKAIATHSVLSVYNQDVISVKENLATIGATRPHVDRELKMFVCLLYCPDPGDNLGGDLYLYDKWDDGSFVVKKVVPYKTGNLIIFPNLANAWHGVAPRKSGPFQRKMVCVTFDTYDKNWVSSIRENSPELRFAYGRDDY